ncbi:hypothetical protein EMIT07CA2_40195 [Brevibacillus sp. IT-7CA2]
MVFFGGGDACDPVEGDHEEEDDQDVLAIRAV